MTKIYHERQKLYRCGLHALNNALQDSVFTQREFEDACEKLAEMTDFDATNALAWIWNPHRAPLGLGNYDVNVLVFVLQQKGYRTAICYTHTGFNIEVSRLLVGYRCTWFTDLYVYTRLCVFASS
ncbi:Uncharacterized conserved protein, contains Josephin domain [Plasmopara halstedii]|uniref:ubiquitinyl hydrolase 1 n=1 Tax=Plasmopara halstedii TaxID=4781 RepID=A0A0N7L382_PLAHL|nr:Uncharacterized conserved protein, contains Josephin domain [Plasmopara halstedii]CEG35147.1 Uncharacterized conserved protein, contains Josephin domain [Plasmopara halstedii]|eukprot:XP_024571516.1 Uncharacterized conserved protein, contains Josephin domain [Plasmopara halstedii]